MKAKLILWYTNFCYVYLISYSWRISIWICCILKKNNKLQSGLVNSISLHVIVTVTKSETEHFTGNTWQRTLYREHFKGNTLQGTHLGWTEPVMASVVECQFIYSAFNINQFNIARDLGGYELLWKIVKTRYIKMI